MCGAFCHANGAFGHAGKTALGHVNMTMTTRLIRARLDRRLAIRVTAASALAVLLLAGATGSGRAQDNDHGWPLDRIFNGSSRFGGGDRPAQPAAQIPGDDRTGSAGGDLLIRLDRAESQIRQLTGTIEQLQFRNQQLENQVRRMQEDTDYRFQELGTKGGARAAAPRPQSPPMQSAPMQGAPMQPPPPQMPSAGATSGRRGDAFDPAQNPDAPGVPHQLGSVASASQPPGGAMSGAPMSGAPMSGAPMSPPMGAQPPGQQMATLPPSQSPRDEYDLAYGYMLRKDYALAEDGFRAFLNRYPSDRLAGDATYWLGESMFLRQRYRDAAEAFLNVTTKFESSAKAPDALLRLGQSLAALGEKEAACASLGEVGRKFPRASAVVKQGVEREQKRVHC